MKIAKFAFAPIAILSVAVFAAFAAFAGNVVYVSPNGSNTPPYDTWDKATTNLQTAADLYEEATVVVRGELPMLNTRLVLDKKTFVYGEDGAVAPLKRGVSIANAGVVVSNLTLRGYWWGYNSSGAHGVQLNAAGLLTHCTVTNFFTCFGNDAQGITAYDGGGVGIRAAGAVVRNCTIAGNTCWGKGCGVYIGANALVEKCLITGNRDNADSSTPVGIGAYVAGGGTLRNCLVVKNGSNKYNVSNTGVVVANGLMESCTVADNFAGTMSDGKALKVSWNGRVKNCIVYNNTNKNGTDTHLLDIPGDGVTYTSVSPAISGKGNTTDAPVFVPGTYKLADCSLVDQGSTQAWMDGATDFYGTMRVLGEAVDMGASEYKPAAYVTVLGSPAAYGTADPDYGKVDAWDGEKTFTCPESYTDGETVNAVCTGWKLRKGDGTELSGEGNAVSLTYSDDLEYATLTWHWAVTRLTDRYVKPDGDDTADGKTWATAWATPQKAIDAYPEATIADGIKIYLGEGTFTDAQTILNLTNAVEVIGAGMGKTILRPDNSAAQPTVINACAGAVVRGVTITGNSKARALKFVGSAGIVEQCCIGTNTMGGVWFFGNTCSGLVSRCEISCNTGADKGGGVFFDDVRTAYAIVENSLIVGNKATGSNPTQNGGGAVFNNGSNSEGTLRYCTIVNNYSPVGAVNNYYGMGNRCRFYNCVFFGNTCAPTESTPEFSPGFYGSAYTVKNCHTLDGRGTNPIVGRINFVDADSGDWHLRLSSCARNAGFLVSADDVNKLDLDGNARVVGDLPDAGCYEFQVPAQTVCDVSASADEGSYGEPSVTFTGFVSGSGDYAYDWQLLDAADEVVATGSGTTFEPELSGYGYLSVRLDVTNLADAGDTASYTLKKAALVRPNVTYVVPEDAPNAGAGSYPYASWETATTDWNAAIAAVRDGGEVVFSNGTYVLDEQIQLERPITLTGLGGYSETTLKRSSTGNARLVYLTCKEAVVRGFTITGGNPNENWTYGVGARISGKGGTLADCRVTANNASQFGGGAVYVSSADGRVTRCLIDNNKYTGSYSFTAGGVLMEAGQIDSSLILNNKGWQTGGVLLSGSAKMYNCTILGNTAGAGSNDYKGGGVGVGALSGDGGIRNCIVKDNVGNAGASSKGGFPEWFITTTDAAKIDAIKAAVRNCCFGKNFANPLGVDWVNADPLFNGAEDYSLNANSELIDAGIDYDGVDSDTDLAGLPRKSGKDVDVGAYEFDFSKRTVDFSVEPALALAGDIVTFSGLVSGGEEGVAYTYVWTLQNLDRSGDPIVRNGQKLSLDTLSPGRYSATLTVTETESGADVGAKTLPLVTTIGAKTVYVVTAVDYEGDGGEWPYDEWDKATTNALTAVESAQAGATVLLGDGEHVIDAELVIEKAITVKGLNGWEKSTLRHNTKAGKARVVGINNQEAKVEGLTITGGNLETTWSKGLAVLIGTQGGTLSKCRVTGNVFPMLGVEGVVFVDYSDAVGGIGSVENCIIDNNSHTTYQYYQTGGGLLLNGGVARNCLLYGNVGCQYGGIGVYGPATVQNCTVVSNIVQYGKGSTSMSGAGGINFATSSKGARIENCIFAFNHYGKEPSDFLACGSEAVTNAANAAISTCLFTDGSEAGANQIMGQPVFRKIGATVVDGNWRLRSRSPGYKTGLYDASWMADGVDIYGEPRTKHDGPQGPVVDIGAAEADWRGSGLTILVW